MQHSESWRTQALVGVGPACAAVLTLIVREGHSDQAGGCGQRGPSAPCSLSISHILKPASLQKQPPLWNCSWTKKKENSKCFSASERRASDWVIGLQNVQQGAQHPVFFTFVAYVHFSRQDSVSVT